MSDNEYLIRASVTERLEEARLRARIRRAVGDAQASPAELDGAPRARRLSRAYWAVSRFLISRWRNTTRLRRWSN